MSATTETPQAPARPEGARAGAEPSIDDLFAAAGQDLTTRLSEPERRTPARERDATPDSAPESAPADTPDEAADTTAQRAPAPETGETRERDESGRFIPREGEQPAPARERTPAQQPPGEPDAATKIALLERQLAATHGNIQNAAAQAAAKAREEARAEAEQQERQRIAGMLNEYERQGHDVREAREAWVKEWADADQKVRHEHETRSRVESTLSQVEVDGQQKLLTLYHHGTQVLAEDVGLPQDVVRAFWAEPEERQRFLRASLQAQMAEKIPGAGFNRAALEDYMLSARTHLEREAKVHKHYTGELAALRKENERLQRELNREEADSPALRAEAPARGAGPRRKEPSTMEEAGAELEKRLRASPELLRR